MVFTFSIFSIWFFELFHEKQGLTWISRGRFGGACGLAVTSRYYGRINPYVSYKPPRVQGGVDLNQLKTPNLLSRSGQVLPSQTRKRENQKVKNAKNWKREKPKTRKTENAKNQKPKNQKLKNWKTENAKKWKREKPKTQKPKNQKPKNWNNKIWKQTNQKPWKLRYII